LTELFPKWTNRLPAAAAVGAVVGLGLVILIVTYYFSPRYTDVGYAPEQPIAYSHKLHAGLLGFDCRYCHTTVEHAAFAAIPPTETCINCHAANRVKGDSARLALLRDSSADGNPVPWVKVHMLPDYVYFDHSVHITAGVGCASCHGRVDQMEVVRQMQPLSMSWCLECHMAPENHLRPTGEVFNMAYEHDPEVAKTLVEQKNIKPPIHCSACHR
jgi:hypothetical protein